MNSRRAATEAICIQWNEVMRNCQFFCTIALVLVWLCSITNAQDNGIFSGQGVRFPESKKPLPTKSKWPKLLDFSKDEPDTSASTPMPFSSLFAKKPKVEKPEVEKSALEKLRITKPNFDLFKRKPGSQPGLEKPNPLSGKPFNGLTELFPKRDPNRPSMFAQMNSKSKSFLDRTTGWTERKNRKMRDKSASTWDAITKDWRAIQSDAERNTIAAQPPVRTAEAPDKPRVRF